MCGFGWPHAFTIVGVFSAFAAGVVGIFFALAWADRGE